VATLPASVEKITGSASPASTDPKMRGLFFSMHSSMFPPCQRFWNREIEFFVHLMLLLK
jgi:hypothetical protein